MFEKRTEGRGIFFTSSHTPGQILKSTIEEGDDVILKIDNESVLVKNVKLLSNNNYSGIVYGFEPSFALDFNGVKIEDEVKFCEENIISCSQS